MEKMFLPGRSGSKTGNQWQ